MNISICEKMKGVEDEKMFFIDFGSIGGNRVSYSGRMQKPYRG
jgi:hypothetical protein